MTSEDPKCAHCGGTIKQIRGHRQRQTCGDVCRQRLCRDRKAAACPCGRAYTWEMINGSGGHGYVVKDDTPSGRAYLARKARDQEQAKKRAQKHIADFVAPEWFRGKS